MENQGTYGSSPDAGWRTSEEAYQTQQIWPCPFCPKTFRSSHAVGGHQNSHRQERDKRMKALYAQHLSCRPPPPPLLSIPPPLPEQYYSPHGPINEAEPVLGATIGRRLAPISTRYGGGSCLAPEYKDRYGPWLTLGLPGLENRGGREPNTRLKIGYGAGLDGPARGPNIVRMVQVERSLKPPPLSGQNQGGSDDPCLELSLYKDWSVASETGADIEMDLNLKL